MSLGVRGARLRAHIDQDSPSSSTLSSKTEIPLAQASGVEYSRGLWLMPSYSPRTKIIPVGQIEAISCASCPAPERIDSKLWPAAFILSAINACISGAKATRSVLAVRRAEI